MAADALFAFDRADLTPEAEKALLSLEAELASRPGAKLSIEGHTDAAGDPAQVLELVQVLLDEELAHG